LSQPRHLRFRFSTAPKFFGRTELNAYCSEIKSITAQRVFSVAWIYRPEL
jgi:hypothetical protein